MAGNKNKACLEVALVDPDAPVREILAGWIRNAPGFHCTGEFNDAPTALAQLPRDKPDLVLFDLNVTGIEWVRELKTLLPDTQFVMVTTYEDADLGFNALCAGASGCLGKQMRRPELLAALREIHAGGSPVSSQIARKVAQFFYQREAQAIGGATGELSPHERELLLLVARGFPGREIAGQLKTSEPAIGADLRRIYEKLHASSRVQAAAP